MFGVLAQIEAASNWLLARSDRMLLIPGTSPVRGLDENVAAIELELDDADLAALDHVEPSDSDRILSRVARIGRSHAEKALAEHPPGTGRRRITIIR